MMQADFQSWKRFVLYDMPETHKFVAGNRSRGIVCHCRRNQVNQVSGDSDHARNGRLLARFSTACAE